MVKKIVLLITVCLLLCGCASTEKYKIGNASVNVQGIYFDDTETLVCNLDNPYYTQILEEIETFSGQKPAPPDMGVFVHDPDVTIIASNDYVYEIGVAISDPIIEYTNGDETTETYFTYYYVRQLKSGVKQSFTYYECGEDGVPLLGIKADAIAYEYTSDKIGTVQGVVIGIFEKSNYTECVIDSPEYDRIWLYVEDSDYVIVGDTVQYTVTSIDEDNGRYYGTIENMTNNDMSQTSDEYITDLSFEYYIMTVPREPDMLDVSRTQVSTETSKEDFDFTLSLYEDRLPKEVLHELKLKYDEAFFEDHFLLYYGMEVTDVEITAVVQQNWLGGENEVYIKRLTDEEVSQEEHRIVWIEVSRDEWNGYSFYGYRY